MRSTILRLLIPLQRFIQKLHRPEPRINGAFFRFVDWQIANGDVLLSREDWHFTNYFIPGFWSHAALSSSESVIEAVGEGVKTVERAEWIIKKDYVMVLRPIFLSEDQKDAASEFAKDQVGEGYNYEFNPSDKQWYCSWLVYRAFRWAKHRSPFVLRKTWGIPTVTPQDFENAVKSGKFDIIADSRDEKWNKR